MNATTTQTETTTGKHYRTIEYRADGDYSASVIVTAAGQIRTFRGQSGPTAFMRDQLAVAARGKQTEDGGMDSIRQWRWELVGDCDVRDDGAYYGQMLIGALDLDADGIRALFAGHKR